MSRLRASWVPAGFLAATAALAFIASSTSGCIDGTEGEKLWRKNCAECHGSTGKGNLPAYSRYPLVNLVDDAWSGSADPGSLEEIVLRGVFPVMPPFDHLSDEEIAAIMEHLRVLRGEAY